MGPDHLAELVAFHLHRLGVADAESVVFISDGARWIGDRLAWIESKAGLDPSRTTHVLDFCHAAHHISLALEALGLEGGKRRAMYVRLRAESSTFCHGAGPPYRLALDGASVEERPGCGLAKPK